jgi:hypothetical protein
MKYKFNAEKGTELIEKKKEWFLILALKLRIQATKNFQYIWESFSLNTLLPEIQIIPKKTRYQYGIWKISKFGSNFSRRFLEV